MLSPAPKPQCQPSKFALSPLHLPRPPASPITTGTRNKEAGRRPPAPGSSHLVASLLIIQRTSSFFSLALCPPLPQHFSLPAAFFSVPFCSIENPRHLLFSPLRFLLRPCCLRVARLFRSCANLRVGYRPARLDPPTSQRQPQAKDFTKGTPALSISLCLRPLTDTALFLWRQSNAQLLFCPLYEIYAPCRRS